MRTCGDKYIEWKRVPSGSRYSGSQVSVPTGTHCSSRPTEQLLGRMPESFGVIEDCFRFGCPFDPRPYRCEEIRHVHP